MSRNFELLQKLEQEQRSRRGLVPPSGAMARREISSPPVEAAPEARPAMHDSDEVCKLVWRLFLLAPDSPRVVVFSSVERRAGCTWMAAQCAHALAAHVRSSVCVVDANLLFPALHSVFEVDNNHGFVAAMSHSQSLAQCAKQLTPRNLWLVPSGGAPGREIILDIDSLRECMRQLREQFDYAVIDAPSWHSHGYAAVLGSAADGIVLVLKADSSRRSTTHRFVAEAKAANIHLLGAVLNQRTFPIPQVIYDRF